MDRRDFLKRAGLSAAATMFPAGQTQKKIGLALYDLEAEIGERTNIQTWSNA